MKIKTYRKLFPRCAYCQYCKIKERTSEYGYTSFVPYCEAKRQWQKSLQKIRFFCFVYDSINGEE